MTAGVTTAMDWPDNSTENGTEAPLCKLSEGNAIHVVGSFISLLIIAENALVLAALSAQRGRLKMVLYIFIRSLAISDLLSGVVFFYTFLFNDLLSLDNSSTATWILRKSSIISSLVVSIGSLQLISMDRFISVTNPIDHDKIMTRRRAIALVILVWLFGVAWVVAPMAGWNCVEHCVCETATLDGTPNCPEQGCSRLFPPITDSYIISSIGIFVVLTLGITFCNAAVFARVKKHFNRMAKTRMSKKSKQDERELAVFMATVFIVFLLCWLPSVVLLSVDSTQPKAYISDDVFDLCSMPALLNSLINPWLYAIKLRTCRKVLVNWLCKCVRRESRYRMFKLSDSTVVGRGESVGSNKSIALKNVVATPVGQSLLGNKKTSNGNSLKAAAPEHPPSCRTSLGSASD